VTSISDFITSEKYLGKIKVEIQGTEERLNSLSQDDKLRIAIGILEKISTTLQSDKVEYQGTKEFKPDEISKVFKNKTLSISVNEDGDQEYGVAQSQTSNQALRIDISKKEWYAFSDNFGTSEEKYLVKFIDKAYDALKTRFSEIYLIRNERHFQLYNFEDGTPVEPDFVLFLKRKESDITLHYQVIIEPKGAHLLEHDAWKESFLKALKKRSKIEQLWKSRKFVIWGMPFFNEEQRKTKFENAFNEILQ
jgi:type III restriction enzyme